MLIDLSTGWRIFQDVHDTAEAMGVYREDFDRNQDLGNQLSEWEDLPQLRHLQLTYAPQPYFGRDLRYFNQAPWWYRRDFDLPGDARGLARVTFTNADYYCKVWLNGKYLGAHEGYSAPFTLDASQIARPGRNCLVVKVWSPWDDAVDGNRQDRRTYMVYRGMVKGTYEHSDTFIQRDVNPVGLYGRVTVEITDQPCFAQEIDITYELDEGMENARLRVAARVENVRPGCRLCLRLTDRLTGETAAQASSPIGDGQAVLEAAVCQVRLWNTWDKGAPYLYDARVWLEYEGRALNVREMAVGFRKVELLRDKERTTLMLNGRRLYVRGTSYFPDVYVSSMTRERYQRDLLAIKAAGFNLVRVHVHVEQPIFYQLASELGIALMQDSEYNWMHPFDGDFARRFIDVYLDTVRLLKRYPAMLVWILMNEPGLEDPAGRASGRAMTVNPGPALVRAVRELDPSRPVIKGSFCEDDPQSGDSHNYTGSLNGPDQHYADIFATMEKLNTEYGFDAPPCRGSLERCPAILRRLNGILDRVDEIQNYQYALLKYYTEHYRMQKGSGNGGYVQFLFSDLCPQSFYGLYDWWGLPKKGLDAMLESNRPLGVFLKYDRERTYAIYAVNDSDEDLGQVRVEWVFTDGQGRVVEKGEAAAALDADGILQAAAPSLTRVQAPRLDVHLLLRRGGQVLSANRYHDLWAMPAHVAGHPTRVSHELGMRLYFAQ